MRKLLLLTVFTIGLFSCKQKKVSTEDIQDSPQKILEDFQVIYSTDSISLMIKHLRDKNIDNDSLIANIYFRGGMRFFQLSKYENANEQFQKAEVLYNQLKIQKKAMQMLSNQAVISGLLGEYTKATKTYLKVLKYYKKMKDSVALGKVYANLAVMYEELEFLHKSLDYYHKAIAIRSAMKDSLGLAKLYNNIGVLNEELLYDNDSAMIYFIKALPIFQQYQMEDEVALLNSNIANIYTDGGRYRKAEEHLSTAQNLYQKKLSVATKGHLMRSYGVLYLVQKQYDKAKEFLEKSIQLFSLAEKRNKILEVYTLLSKVSHYQGDYNSAVMYMDNFIQLKDSLFSEENRALVLQMESKYQLQEKKRAIDHLKYENLTHRQSVRNRNILLLTTVIILLLVLTLFYQYSRKKILLQDKMQLEIANYILEVSSCKERIELSTKEKSIKVREQILKHELTEREGEVLMCLFEGAKNAEIAENLHLSINTVKSHIKNIYIKLNVNNRKEAIRRLT